MAAINFAGNTYSGEVLEDLLVYTAHGCDTYEKGLVHIKPGIQKKYTLPHISLGEIIQDNVATPQSGQSKGEYKLSERYLEPSDFMVYLEFNPRDFEEFWKPFQPDGELVFRELDPSVQATMLRLLIDKKDQYINDAIWMSRKGGVGSSEVTTPATCTKPGDTSAAGPMKYFNGFLVRVLENIKSDANVNEKASGQVLISGNTELTTGEQVEQALYATWMKCPKNLRKSNKLKFVMGWEAWDLYDQYLTSKQVKYADNSVENKRTFKGKPIVVIDGAPEHTIALGKFTTDQDSCLWMGIDYAADETSVRVEPLQANSELYFFQMRLKMDVNIVRPSEIIVWTAYKNGAA